MITEFPSRTAGSGPFGITAGSGRQPLVHRDRRQPDRPDHAGGRDHRVRRFPTPDSGPFGITAGPDGALWFTEVAAPNQIGRITTAGAMTEFAVPTPGAPGPDHGGARRGAVVHRVGVRTRSAGSPPPARSPSSLFPTPDSGPDGIAAGPDGALWFTESYAANKIGRITTAGTVTEFPIPTAAQPSRRIAAGPDGALWFTERRQQDRPDHHRGAITEFAIPDRRSRRRASRRARTARSGSPRTGRQDRPHHHRRGDHRVPPPSATAARPDRGGAGRRALVHRAAGAGSGGSPRRARSPSSRSAGQRHRSGSRPVPDGAIWFTVQGSEPLRTDHDRRA